MEDVVIVSGARTPVGDFGGSLRDVLPHQLAGFVVEEVLNRGKVEKEKVEEIVLGNCLQRSDEPNLARVVAVENNFPKETMGFTVQKQCASGMQAVISGAQAIRLEDAEVTISGGAESMSSTPYVLKQARWGARLQHGEMTDALWELLMDPHYKIMMGETAENLAEKYGITREEQDEIAFRSHTNASKAISNGIFEEEIIPVNVSKRKKQISVDTDEHPREDVSIEQLASLKPAFRKGGTVTAGNASGINDGAAALLLMSASKAQKMDLKPLGRIVSYAGAGVEPDLMGYGPVPATQKALQKADMNLGQIELIELNEAFAAQYLACEKLLDLNRDITNVNGSGVALGHPVGCTGARIIVSLLHEMARRDLKIGLATLCVGGGMGMATIVERFK